MRNMDNTKQAIELLKKAIDLLNNNSNSIANKPSIANKANKYYPKDKEFLQKLIQLQKANNSNTTFLESILNNDYDTLTDGQYSVVVNIANNFNLSPDGI